MERRSPFRFEEADFDFSEVDGYLFRVDAPNISTQGEVFSSFGKGLMAPNCYFGENWNAFRDCLLDLDWIKKRDVYIIHEEVPNLSEDDLMVYLDILCDCVNLWGDKKTDELARQFPEFVPHRLHVYFPKESEVLVHALLRRAIESR